jgi:hypothetical protein
MGAGQDLDRHLLGRCLQRSAQLVAVGADHVGQRVRSSGVALGPRGDVPLPVAGDLQRVDREHLVAGGDQRGPHPPRSVSIPTATCSGAASSGKNRPISPCSW